MSPPEVAVVRDGLRAHAVPIRFVASPYDVSDALYVLGVDYVGGRASKNLTRRSVALREGQEP